MIKYFIVINNNNFKQFTSFIKLLFRFIEVIANLFNFLLFITLDHSILHQLIFIIFFIH